MPKDEDIRREVVRIYHDSPPAGHPGRWKTYELVSRNYWWPGLSTFVERYVSGCDTCARTKNTSHRPVGQLQPNPVPDGPWQVVTCDFITQLPESEGYDAIFVTVDRLTKMVHLAPTHSTVDAPDTADLFLNLVWKHHGTPKQVISDRGPQFVSRFLKAMFERLGIKGSTSTAYHPQTDGQTERVNQELEQYLRAFTDVRQSNWASLLPVAEFAHNTRAHSATKVSPFKALYGYDPEFVVAPASPAASVPRAEERLDELKAVQDEAKAALEVAAERMKHFYDRMKAESPEYNPGDRVWLDARNVALTGTRKLNPRRLGPFEVVKKVSPLNYELKLPATWRIHPVFHTTLLSPHMADTIPGRPLQPAPPVMVEGTEEYEVEGVLDSRFRRGGLEYLVRWKGYSAAEDTW